MSKAEVGDIVSCIGYGGNAYEVQSINDSYSVILGEEYYETTYGLTNVENYYDFIIAFEEDIEVVCPKSQAEEYVKKRRENRNISDIDVNFDIDAQNIVGGMFDILNMINVGFEIESDDKSNLAETLRMKEDEINSLLEELYDRTELVKLVGDDDENNYEEDTAEIKTELKEIVEGK